jgi:hypothetical protein
MPNYANVTFKNATLGQHVYTITDDVLHQDVVQNQPLAPGETVSPALVVDENGHGQATYGYSGGIRTRLNDLNDGDSIDMT